jgi:hypothetical protein
MKRFFILVLLLSAVGCMHNRWGLLYKGRYSSAHEVQAYAKKHGLTYEEAWQALHSEEQKLWDQKQQEQQPQIPVNAVEAKQTEPAL